MENIIGAKRRCFAGEISPFTGWQPVSGSSSLGIELSSRLPIQAKNAACILRRIALDDSFPHLLIRSFARDACEKLIKAGQISLADAECDLLKSVNESPLPREPEVRKTGTYGHGLYGCLDKDRRFNFDPVDTIPYWYQPMLRSFSDVAIGHFLREVERWIIDVWDYNDNSLDPIVA